MLIQHPEMGAQLQRQGYEYYRKLPWGSHVIVYRVENGNLEITALPHKNMKLYRQINKATFQ
jgi:plasmid stabilization system protein ParE